MIKLILCIIMISTNAFASSIVAKVNDAPISKYDLENYTKLALATGQISPSDDEIQKLKPQILEQLIEQKIRINAIEDARIDISKEQIDDAIKNIEMQSKTKEGSLRELLKSQNIPQSILDEKISADIGWFQILNMKFGKNINISEDEIDAEIENVKKKYNKTHILLYEIFIPVPSVLQDNEIYYQTLDMIKAIKDSGNFSGYAKQFSRSPTKEKGGEIGWLPIDSLPDEFKKKIVNLDTGAVSDPIRTADGYYILLIKDKKEGTAPSTIDDATKAKIEANLKGKKLDQFAKKYLRDLMQQSIIEKTEK